MYIHICESALEGVSTEYCHCHGKCDPCRVPWVSLIKAVMIGPRLEYSERLQAFIYRWYSDQPPSNTLASLVKSAIECLNREPSVDWILSIDAVMKLFLCMFTLDAATVAAPSFTQETVYFHRPT